MWNVATYGSRQDSTLVGNYRTSQHETIEEAVQQKNKDARLLVGEGYTPGEVDTESEGADIQYYFDKEGERRIVGIWKS